MCSFLLRSYSFFSLKLTFQIDKQKKNCNLKLLCIIAFKLINGANADIHLSQVITLGGYMDHKYGWVLFFLALLLFFYNYYYYYCYYYCSFTILSYYFLLFFLTISFLLYCTLHKGRWYKKKCVTELEWNCEPAGGVEKDFYSKFLVILLPHSLS